MFSNSKIFGGFLENICPRYSGYRSYNCGFGGRRYAIAKALGVTSRNVESHDRACDGIANAARNVGPHDGLAEALAEQYEWRRSYDDARIAKPLSRSTILRAFEILAQAGALFVGAPIRQGHNQRRVCDCLGILCGLKDGPADLSPPLRLVACIRPPDEIVFADRPVDC